MKLIKAVIPLLLVIWFFGALVMVVIYKVEEKKNCINQDGIIKGLLFCEASPNNKFNTYTNYLEKLANGLKWPIYILEQTYEEKHNNNEISKANTFTKEDFNKSPLGMLYTCYTIASLSNLKEEERILINLINAIRKLDNDFNYNHEISLYYSKTYIKSEGEKMNYNYKLLFEEFTCHTTVNNIQKKLGTNSNIPKP
jgi:hypothetical protein